jgi:hypothetical protein
MVKGSKKGKRVAVVPPAPLAKALGRSAAARARWESLPPSHQREYAVWISGAKREETLARRLALAVEMLEAGRKTPMRANDAPQVSAAPLATKLGVKPGLDVVVMEAPDGYGDRIPGASARGKGDVVLAFAKDSRALAKVGPKALAAAKEGGRVWIAYPKKSSGIPTDLTRDVGWASVTKAGWRTVALVAIDEAWSAARLRPT